MADGKMIFRLLFKYRYNASLQSTNILFILNSVSEIFEYKHTEIADRIEFQEY